jgi:hypothetical protein
MTGKPTLCLERPSLRKPPHPFSPSPDQLSPTSPIRISCPDPSCTPRRRTRLHLRHREHQADSPSTISLGPLERHPRPSADPSNLTKITKPDPSAAARRDGSDESRTAQTTRSDAIPRANPPPENNSAPQSASHPANLAQKVPRPDRAHFAQKVSSDLSYLFTSDFPPTPYTHTRNSDQPMRILRRKSDQPLRRPTSTFFPRRTVPWPDQSDLSDLFPLSEVPLTPSAFSPSQNPRLALLEHVAQLSHLRVVPAQ